MANSENLPRLVFIDEEWKNLTVVVDGLLEILSKRKSQSFYKSIDVHYVTNAKGEIVSSKSMWNIVNKLSEHDFSCGLIFRGLE